MTLEEFRTFFTETKKLQNLTPSTEDFNVACNIFNLKENSEMGPTSDEFIETIGEKIRYLQHMFLILKFHLIGNAIKNNE